MKRSDMIDLMVKEYYIYIEGQLGDTKPVDMMDMILHKMELVGIKPPFTGKFREENIINRWGQDTGKTEWCRVIVSEWDNE